ncbi:MAG: prohibitin family protein [Myxococcota bacterium]
MRTWKIAGCVLAGVLWLSGCTIVRQGEVGVRRTLGRLDDATINAGPRIYNPFITRIIKVETQTRNLEITLSLPSKEGLNVSTQISILYRVRPEMAPVVVEELGLDYERIAILSVFRSAAADVSAQYLARDMYTNGRGEIEHAIAERMQELLFDRGFEIEAVLLKSIDLPPNLFRAIEAKLEAEQEAQRMEFVLQQEQLEASRRQIEAEGIRESNKILSEGITEDLIRWQTIEAFRMLSTSPNAKIIITDGNSPILLEQ